MGDAVLFLLHAGTIAAIAAAMVRPSWRPRAAFLVTGVGVLAAAAAAVLGDATRHLELFHTFASYEGAEIRLKPFPVDEVDAPGWAWGLCALLFCGIWALWLRRTAPGDAPESARIGARVHGFWGPLLLCWTALGLELALQKTAAPEGLVAPLPFDRAILPAALAACVILAVQCRRVVLVLAWLSVFVTFARLPLLLFGTYATHEGIGTTLDVHRITLFANPLAQSPVEVDAYSPEQLGWLIWGPNLLVMPGLYMLSLGGIAFAITMFVLHPKTAHGAHPPGE